MERSRKNVTILVEIYPLNKVKYYGILYIEKYYNMQKNKGYRCLI